MVRPSKFIFNPQTSETNSFQSFSSEPENEISSRALLEFENLRNLLEKNGIQVFCLDDDRPGLTPDSLFPNNWISFHENRTLVVYPMMAQNRRLEKRKDWIELMSTRFEKSTILDLSHFENRNQFLEGTGSMVLDREHKVAYAAFSSRTDPLPLQEFCDKMGYALLAFHAQDEGVSIYRTNVLMALGETEAIVCFESICDPIERKNLADQLKRSSKEIIDISVRQMKSFCGNLIQLQNSAAEKFWVGSEAALAGLTASQRQTLARHSRLLSSNLSTIERLGGGSARCMLCEIF